MKCLRLSCLLILPILTSSVVAQSRPGRPSTGSGTGTGRRTTVPTMPSAGTPRSTFISGRVTVDDGTPITSPVAIQTNCRGQLRTRGYSDSKGYFSLELNNNQQGIAASSDASESMSIPLRGANRTLSNEWQTCQLQASLPGFVSRTVELAAKLQDMGPNDVGTLVLHRMEQVEGFTLSATSAAAPSKARKNFEKGSELAKKGKLDDAKRKLEEAVEVYPNYAAAWVELGRVQAQEKDVASARASFERALSADSKFLLPYEELSKLALAERDWAQLDAITDKLLELNPVSFPEYWFYNAAANYYLQRPADCEKSARQGLHVDSQHRIPKLEFLLATVLSDKHSYQEAAEHMRNFVRLAPPGQDSDNAKKAIEKLDQLSAKAETTEPTPPSPNAPQQ